MNLCGLKRGTRKVEVEVYRDYLLTRLAFEDGYLANTIGEAANVTNSFSSRPFLTLRCCLRSVSGFCLPIRSNRRRSTN